MLLLLNKDLFLAINAPLDPNPVALAIAGFAAFPRHPASPHYASSNPAGDDRH